MRKAKFLLGAIVAFGIVGGIFAFKTKASQAVFVKSTPTATECLSTLAGYTLTTTFTNVAVTTIPTFVTDAPGICTITRLYYTGL
jgi:hypothetical protein